MRTSECIVSIRPRKTCHHRRLPGYIKATQMPRLDLIFDDTSSRTKQKTQHSTTQSNRDSKASKGSSFYGNLDSDLKVWSCGGELGAHIP